MTTTPIRECLAVEVRLLLTVLVIPFAFDFTLIALAWRAGTIVGLLAAWARPANRYIDRLDLRQRGARP